MAKQKSFSTSPLNPFDKSQGAAAQFMPSQSPQILVANVEQQYQQQNNQKDITTEAETTDIDNVDGIEQQHQQKTKTPKREFPGRQHLHLIVPEQMAADIKQLAKIRNVSVNVFVQEVLATALIEYKPVLKQLTLMNQKLGMNTKVNKTNKII